MKKRRPSYEERRKNDPELKARRREVDYQSYIKRRFGITFDEYLVMFREQAGNCAICLRQPEKHLNVDHCHDTGKVRGLLCSRCNLALGHLGDDIEAVFRAAMYLQASKKAA